MSQREDNDTESNNANFQSQQPHRRRRRRSNAQASDLPPSSPEQGAGSPAAGLASPSSTPVENDKPGHFSLAGAGIYSFSRMVLHCGKSNSAIISAKLLHTITHLDLSRNRLEVGAVLLPLS